MYTSTIGIVCPNGIKHLNYESQLDFNSFDDAYNSAIKRLKIETANQDGVPFIVIYDHEARKCTYFYHV